MDLTFDMSFIRKRENYSRAVYNTMDEVLVQNILHAIIGRLYKKKYVSNIGLSCFAVGNICMYIQHIMKKDCLCDYIYECWPPPETALESKSQELSCFLPPPPTPWTGPPTPLPTLSPPPATWGPPRLCGPPGP